VHDSCVGPAAVDTNQKKKKCNCKGLEQDPMQVDYQFDLSQKIYV
jgi:hypothetical protein